MYRHFTKGYITLLFSILFLRGVAQVGINNPVPEASSLVDVTSIDKGVLIPRLTLIQRSAIPSPATGLLVYQTTTPEGFYFFNGTIWEKLTNTNDIGWSVNGNAGAVNGINFVGTTDNRKFSVGTNGNSSEYSFTTFNQLVFSNSNDNTYIGNEAAEFASGIFDLVIGTQALYSSFPSSTGLNSIAGFQAAYNSVNCSSSSLLGYKSAKSATSITTSSFFGYQSGVNCITSVSNTFIAANSGHSITTGNENIFAGYNSGFNNSTGSKNTGIGSNSLLQNTTGGFNIGIGNYALNNNLSASNLVAIGDSALFQCVQSENTAIGYNVLNKTNSGFGNTAFGNYALYNNISGSKNVSIGNSSLKKNSSGNNNIALGINALANLQSDSNNIAIGSVALYDKTSGSNNIAVGYVAGLYNYTGGNNINIGNASGLENLYGSGNIFIGSEAEAGPPNLINAIAIGARSRVDVNNAIVLGSIAGINGATSSIDVGIGTFFPIFDLHVGRGSMSATNLSDIRVVVTDEFYDNRAAFIAMTKTGSGVKVEGQIEADGAFYDGVIAGSVSSHNVLFRTGNITRATITSSGNFGIGTTIPAFDLQLSSNSAAKPTSSTWTVVSDLRLKTNVGSFNDGLETATSINPVWFTYNGNGDIPKETGVGTIAQELQSIVPYMVNEWESADNSKYLAVDYGAMDFILINSIKELNKRINKNQELIDNLKKEIESRKNNLK